MCGENGGRESDERMGKRAWALWSESERRQRRAQAMEGSEWRGEAVEGSEGEEESSGGGLKEERDDWVLFFFVVLFWFFNFLLLFNYINY